MFKVNTFFYWLAIFMAITFILKVTYSLLIPPTFAILLAFITIPAYRYMIKKKVPAFIALFVIMIFLAFLFYLIFMVIQASLSSIIRAIPKYQETFSLLIKYIIDRFDLANQFDLGPGEGTFIYTKQLTDALYSFLVSFSNQLLSLVNSVLIVFLYYAFFMSEINLFGYKFSLAYTSSYHKGRRILHDIGSQISYYLALKFLVSLVTAFFITLTLLYFKLDFAFVWGILTFIFNFIPNIGSILVVIFIGVFSFLQYFPDFTTPALIILFCTLVQMVMGNVIEPKLQGDKLDLSPFLLLFFFFFWAWVWGAAGMFLAYPLTVVIKVTFQNIEALKPFAILMGSGKIKLEDIEKEENKLEDSKNEEREV